MSNNQTSLDRLTFTLGKRHQQANLDVILSFLPAIRPIPQSGGRLGTEGTAVFGFGSTAPQTIWCIGPVWGGESGRAKTLRRALSRGLERSLFGGFQTIGVDLECLDGLLLPAAEVVEVTMQTLVNHLIRASGFEEIRVFSLSARILDEARQLLPPTGNDD